MKTFKGTPGPWVMDDYGNILHETETGAVGKLRVSGVRLQNRVTDEYAANTRLISASPDLLTALQRLVEVYDSEDGKQWTATSKKAAISEARAAINKALGE